MERQILSHTCYFQSYPYWVTGEELVVRRDTSEFNHTEFVYHVVNKLLCLFLCKGSVLKVSLNIDIRNVEIRPTLIAAPF